MKRKVADLHVGDKRAAAATGAAAAGNTHLLAQRFEVVEHNYRALVKAEVLDGMLQLAVFDIESSIAGKTCIQQCLRDLPHVYTRSV